MCSCVYFCFAVYIFIFLKKKDNFHFGLLTFVDSHENLLYSRMVVEIFVCLKSIDYTCLFERVGLFTIYLHSCYYVLQNYF